MAAPGQVPALEVSYAAVVTTKKVYLKSIIHELIRFLLGATKIAYLKDNEVSIWDECADENDNLGSIYSFQWRG